MTNHEKHEKAQESYWNFFIGRITKPCSPGPYMLNLHSKMLPVYSVYQCRRKGKLPPEDLNKKQKF